MRGDRRCRGRGIASRRINPSRNGLPGAHCRRRGRRTPTTCRVAHIAWLPSRARRCRERGIAPRRMKSSRNGLPGAHCRRRGRPTPTTCRIARIAWPPSGDRRCRENLLRRRLRQCRHMSLGATLDRRKRAVARRNVRQIYVATRTNSRSRHLTSLQASYGNVSGTLAWDPPVVPAARTTRGRFSAGRASRAPGADAPLTARPRVRRSAARRW